MSRGLSTRERVLLAIVVVMVIGFGYFHWEYEPQRKRLLALEGQISQTRAESASFRQAVAEIQGQNVPGKIKQTRGDIIRLQDEIELVKSRMSGKIRDVVRVLRKQAKLHGVRLESIDTTEQWESTQSFRFRRVGIKLRMESEYQAIGRFVQALKEIPAILEIENLEVTRDPVRLPQLETALTMRLLVI